MKKKLKIKGKEEEKEVEKKQEFEEKNTTQISPKKRRKKNAFKIGDKVLQKTPFKRQY